LIKLYTGENLRDGANIALRARLYVSGWELSSVLQFCRQTLRPDQYFIAIKFINGEPVALAYHTLFGDMQAFCKKSERRNGYASACVKAIMTHAEKTGHSFQERRIHYGIGIVGSCSFWASVLPEEAM
jgi:hypothetical protein